jgi:hypothetical protein
MPLKENSNSNNRMEVAKIAVDKYDPNLTERLASLRKSICSLGSEDKNAIFGSKKTQRTDYR